MKKIYFLALGLSVLGTAASAQSLIRPEISNGADAETSGKKVSGRAFKGATYWTSDFEDASVWTMEATDDQHGWLNSDTEKGWSPTTSILSTSGGKYALFRNGNPAANPATNLSGQEWSMTTAAPIDLSAHSSVAITYQIWGRRFTDDLEVSFSTDNENWTVVDLISDNIRSLTSTQPVNDFAPNPQTRYALLPGAGGNATVWIKYRWFSTDSRGIAYSYYIDDVNIVEAPSKEIAISGVRCDNGAPEQLFEYGEMPLTQTHMLVPAATLSNNGGAEQQITVTMAVTKDGNPVGSYSPAAPIVLAPATDSTIYFNAFQPSELGNYEFTFTITSPDQSTETDTTDNTASDVLVVSKGLWADNDGATWSGNGYLPFKEGGTGPNAQVSLVQAFEVLNTGDKAYGIQTVFASFANSEFTADQLIYTDLYKYNGTPAQFAAGAAEITADDYTAVENAYTEYVIPAEAITPAGAPEPIYANVPFAQPLDLTPGVYFAVITMLGGDYIYNLPVTGAETNYDRSGYLRGNIQNGAPEGMYPWNNICPFLKLNLDASSGIASAEKVANAELGQNQPNPFNGTSSINYTTREAGNVTFEVTDVTGKVVKSINQGNQAAGTYKINLNSSEFGAGVYFYSIEVNGARLAKKMVITE